MSAPLFSAKVVRSMSDQLWTNIKDFKSNKKIKVYKLSEDRDGHWGLRD